MHKAKAPCTFSVFFAYTERIRRKGIRRQFFDNIERNNNEVKKAEREVCNKSKKKVFSSCKTTISIGKSSKIDSRRSYLYFFKFLLPQIFSESKPGER